LFDIVDASAFGDATVFWHEQWGDEHLCFVAGKRTSIGEAMGCMSIHDMKSGIEFM
jgi:hypothetical protein